MAPSCNTSSKLIERVQKLIPGRQKICNHGHTARRIIGADDYATTKPNETPKLRFARNNLANIVRNVHGSNPEPLMSALGQKQTFSRV
jgi:hypothetical protein